MGWKQGRAEKAVKGNELNSIKMYLKLQTTDSVITQYPCSPIKRLASSFFYSFNEALGNLLDIVSITY